MMPTLTMANSKKLQKAIVDTTESIRFREIFAEREGADGDKESMKDAAVWSEMRLCGHKTNANAAIGAKHTKICSYLRHLLHPPIAERGWCVYL